MSTGMNLKNKISCQLTVDSYTKLDESRIRKLLQEEPWDSVADWKVEIGEDPFDKPAIWVWVILESSQRFEQRDKIRRRVLEIIAGSGETRWVYVQFRTKQEQEELDDLERQEALEADREVSAWASLRTCWSRQRIFSTWPIRIRLTRPT